MAVTGSTGSRTRGRSTDEDDARLVRPDGLAIRGRRHHLGWSPRDCIDAIRRATLRESGIGTTITPHQLMGIEEQNEIVPYSLLRHVAAGLDCNPIELLAADQDPTPG